jgi:hypothetical protein
LYNDKQKQKRFKLDGNFLQTIHNLWRAPPSVIEKISGDYQRHRHKDSACPLELLSCKVWAAGYQRDVPAEAPDEWAAILGEPVSAELCEVIARGSKVLSVSFPERLISIL